MCASNPPGSTLRAFRGRREEGHDDRSGRSRGRRGGPAVRPGGGPAPAATALGAGRDHRRGAGASRPAASAARCWDGPIEEGRAKAEAYREREEAALEHRRLEIGVPRGALRAARGHPGAAGRQPGAARDDPHRAGARGRRCPPRVAEELREQARASLEQVAGVDAKAAKDELLQRVEDEARRDAMVLMRDLEMKAREEADRRAATDPDVDHPASCLRGRDRDHRVDGAPPLRRHEGPDHRT